MTRRTIPCLTAAPWPASPQLRGLCAQTTLLLSPIQEAPLSLGELLNWFSEVSKSWISSSGGPDTTAPLLHPPTKRLPSGDPPADLPGERPGAPSPERERDWPREEWKAHGPGVREQLLSLRHWLDALEKRLLDLQGKGPTTEVSAFAMGPPWGRDQEALGKLLSWVGDMEDLVAGQKPPSSEAKVVKAQLQEQKLLRRLLDERRSHVESLLQERKFQVPPEASGPTEQQAWDKGRGLCSLQEKWAFLVQEAEARHCSLERILPAAQAFQESGDAFQEWLGQTEQALAQLWRANGSLSRGQEACGQAQDLCQEIRSRPAELDQVLERGQRLLEAVSGEEARLAQEKMDSLRMRFLMVSQSSADILQRLEQALEASSRLEPAQEDLALWLSRLEKELPSQEGPVAPADREKLEVALQSALGQVSHLEAQLEGLAQVRLEADALRSQLEEQKLVSAGILHHQGLVERLVPIAGLMLSRLPPDVQQHVQLLVQPLQERTEGLLRRSAACAVSLEQAQSLVAQFAEAQGELWPWLQETRGAAEQFSPESLSCEAFKEQQELLQGLREAIAEHKPLVTKLQRVSTQLATLNPQEAASFLQHCREMEDQYNWVRERVRQAAGVLEEAIPRYSQLSERMALMVESLERLRSRLQPPSAAVRGDPAWIREQLRENSLRLAELEKLGVALETLRGQGAELLATVQTSANEEIQVQVEQLLHQWEEMWAQGEERESWLQGLLTLAERFWHGLSDLAAALGDTQQAVMEPAEASSDPVTIRTRLEVMQVLREEIDALQSDLDSLGTLGVELMASCGDPEKPDVTKSLDELYSCWHGVSKAWAERQSWLEEKLQASLAYQETLQRHLGWLGEAEVRMAEAFLVAGNPELVKQQLLELKDFKRELYQRKVEVESARPQGGPRGADGKDPPKALSDFRERWSRLEEAAVGRQHQLEASLLGLGQFQSQLEELLEWLLRTTELLAGPPALPLDLQSCEIELAKHKVLRNDVLSHARTVQSVKEAGQGLLLSGGEGEAGEGLQGRLQELSQRWDAVLGQTESRQMQLESNLGQVQDITLEITDLLQWLERVELQLCFHKPVWGQPEATKDKLVAHMELCKEMEAKQPEFHILREAAQRLLSAGPSPRPSSSSSTEHSLSLLEQKWGSVAGQLQERKEQLSEGLAVTTEFHSSVQQLLSWVERTEEALGALPTPSCVLETLAEQIQEQKALAKEAHSQSEKLAGLEALAARMQDRSTVQSLVLSARERLARVAQQVAERGVLLEEARQRARQFSESWQLLLDWLEEVDLAQGLPSDVAAGQEAIRTLLGEHKEFQKGLRSKRPVYEATLRNGRLLREKASLPEDAQSLEEMLQELKERWGAVSSWAAERQRKLEESLLFSGRFTDALQTLMDWLYQVEPQLAEESPVAGDRDLVLALMDKHKAFQRELGQRASCIKALQRCMRDLIRGNDSGGRASSGDAQWLHSQVEELGLRWELICRLSLSKQDRLEAALRQAEEFHRLVHSFLGRLSELENSIKYGALPEDVAAIQQSQEHMKELRQGLQCQQLELECIASLGEEILSACHPDAAIAIKSWLTITKTRFQEVLSWSQQQEERLQAHGASLVAEQEEVAHLTDWIRAAEEALGLRDEEPLPEDTLQLEELSRQHSVFMEELNRKQPEVEKVTKSCKPPAPSELGAVPTPRRLASRRRSTGRLCPRGPAARLQGEEHPGPQKPLLTLLAHRWQQLWLLALDRQYRLQNAQQRQRELEAFSHFDFAIWRKRYLQWISRLKSRVLDVFRGIDRDQDGRVSLQEFIQSVLSSKFPTNALEMNAVANIFDMNRDGFIDYYEFVSTLHPTRDPMHRAADADQIQDEVNRQVAQCSCAKRFQVEQISANRYRFGESQQLRMVRILRSTLMVRVGGGWIALDEFLVKNDPCRVKGRTNVKINEKYLSADPPGAKGGISQSAPASKALSPSSSSLSLFSSASAPSSPLGRKAVLRRTRSGDRCPRSSCAPREEDGAEAAFAGLAPDGEDPQAEAGPPDPPGEPPP